MCLWAGSILSLKPHRYSFAFSICSVICTCTAVCVNCPWQVPYKFVEKFGPVTPPKAACEGQFPSSHKQALVCTNILQNPSCACFGGMAVQEKSCLMALFPPYAAVAWPFPTARGSNFTRRRFISDYFSVARGPAIKGRLSFWKSDVPCKVGLNLSWCMLIIPGTLVCVVSLFNSTVRPINFSTNEQLTAPQALVPRGDFL